MFVEMDALEALVLFSLIGFLFISYIVGKYSYRFGGWVAEKILNKFFGKREYHETLEGSLTAKVVNCYGTIVYDKSIAFSSNPPKYKGVCIKCGTVSYSLCSNVE